MKRTIGVFIACILTVSLIQAQNQEAITNNSVIKMVKARLSDELIIDMIQNSEINFDLSEGAIQNLKDESVPVEIIKEMQNAVLKQSSKEVKNNQASSTTPPENKPEAPKQVPADTQPVKNETEGTLTPQVINALGYAAPVKSLVSYYENEFEMMSVTISEWDRQIKASLDDAARINEEIAKTESELRDKKNASAENYDSAILLLYKRLAEDRLKYKQIKEKMLQDGANISKKLAELSKNKERSIGKEYDEVSQQVKSFDADPSKADLAVAVTFNKLKINDKTTYFITPATELLYWHQNEIYKVRDLIENWNKKAMEIAQQNVVLNNQLEPLQRQMEEYKTSPKKFKSEISALKKQINATEKEKKQLTWKMSNESSEMAGELKKTSEEIKNSAKERFTDIIANINYYYQEKLNL
jgi:hypothetical protein